MSGDNIYPWYCLVDKGTTLEQGDVLKDCPVLTPAGSNVEITEKKKTIRGKVDILDVIIMTQSCDMAHRKAPLVVVSSVWTLDDFVATNPGFNGPKAKEGLRRGYNPYAHLLYRCDLEGYGGKHLVIDFRQTVVLPIEFVESFITSTEKRLRLLPPYREHLSQSFAKFFMRVGLPLDIPGFNKKATWED